MAEIVPGVPWRRDLAVVGAVRVGSASRARGELPGYRSAKCGNQQGFDEVTARNGVPIGLMYQWRACWPGSRRDRLRADILARIERGE